MHPISPAPWAFAVCALFALPAMAQVTPPPATAKASAPASLPYTSAFEGYQAFTEEKVRPWKESNTTVEKIGGWRAYAKEVAEPQAKHDHAPTASPPAAPKAASAPSAPADPHAGHGKH